MLGFQGRRLRDACRNNEKVRCGWHSRQSSGTAKRTGVVKSLHVVMAFGTMLSELGANSTSTHLGESGKPASKSRWQLPLRVV